jgi:hypothetical protein
LLTRSQMFGLAVFQCSVVAPVWARRQDPVYLYDFHCRGHHLGASEDNSRGQNAAHRVVVAVDEGQMVQRGARLFLRTLSGFARVISLITKPSRSSTNCAILLPSLQPPGRLRLNPFPERYGMWPRYSHDCLNQSNISSTLLCRHTPRRQQLCRHTDYSRLKPLTGWIDGYKHYTGLVCPPLCF